MRIDFITTESIEKTSGGWSGMNINIYQQLSRYFEVNYVGPIQPEIDLFEKIKSKSLRILKLKGDFFFFSTKRLVEIKRQVSSEIAGSKADILFFQGVTPWCSVEPSKKYYAYMDASFSTFLKIYSNPNLFKKKDIERIMQAEKVFFENATQIFSSSQWAIDEIKKDYGINTNNFTVVGLGGNIPIPLAIKSIISKNLLFISVDFEKKGGYILIEAFCQAKAILPDLHLKIVGQMPPKSVLDIAGIQYIGFLNKKNPEDLQNLLSILDDSALLIHPTQKDMTPLVIVEAGYYGVPAIAPSVFGIPEMICNDEAGILIKENTPENICNHILKFMENQGTIDIRQKVYSHFIKNYTWEIVGKSIQSELTKIIS